MIPTPVIASIVGAVAGGLAGWLGNYQFQYRMYRRLRSVDDLKDRLYALLGETCSLVTFRRFWRGFYRNRFLFTLYMSRGIQKLGTRH